MKKSEISATPFSLNLGDQLSLAQFSKILKEAFEVITII